MGAMTLGTFVGVLYAETNPNRTGDCNHGLTDETCIPVFTARGASYAMLTILLLVHGINCRDVGLAHRLLCRCRL